VSYPEGQKTVPSESITQIPFENQCRSALSTLIRTAEKAWSQYHYVNFPFGLMDTKGLKDSLALYDHRNALKRTLEVKKWLNTKASIPHHNMCIKESNLLSSLSTDQITCVQNLVGTQWLTDVSVVYMANLINSTTSSALCMVVQHPTFMFSNELLSKLERVRSGKDVVQDIFVILNVGKKSTGDSKIVFEGGDGGCHWTLLFFHANSPTCMVLWGFFGLAITIKYASVSISTAASSNKVSQNNVQHHPGSRDDHYGHTCRDKCKLFYPIQTCTNVCGVVSVIMAALLSQNRMAWPDSNAIPNKYYQFKTQRTQLFYVKF